MAKDNVFLCGMNFNPEILYEDNHIIVLEKYPGLLSQGDESGDPNLVDMLKEFLKIKYNKPGNVFVGLVHRLDRPVGGIMVFAKTSKALSRLQEQMKARTIDKLYLAATSFAPAEPEGELHHYLLKNEEINLTKVYNAPTDKAKECRLIYKTLGANNNKTLFQIKLITGRSHQIRAQMAHIGCPLLGDVKYGKPLSKPAYVLALYAYFLAFDHPITKQRMHFSYLPKIKGYWKGLQDYFPAQNINE